MEKIRFIITEESMKRLHDSLVMLRASLFSEELKANQSTYISEIGAELSKATIDKEPETCTWTEIEDEDGNYYEASCNGEWHEFIEGAPEDSGFDFCPFCGKPLVQKLVSEK